MNSKKTGKYLSFIKFLPIALCIIFIICYIFFGKTLTVESILKYTPQNPYFAACILLLLYAIKSLSIFFPLIILKIAGGHLFPTGIALLVNIAGMLICYTVSFWIGYFSGTITVDKLTKKYPKLSHIIELQHNNSFFVCFFLRIISFLPMDVVSLYLGATKIPFSRYIFASILGSLPNTILSTLLGASITKPDSPMFWVSILLMILYAGFSLLANYLYKHKSEKGSK